ncbi:MAG: hypothetical protein V5B33_08075 [Candidatus Accumulibacter sp. UW20]|jgi:hypothetical protein
MKRLEFHDAGLSIPTVSRRLSDGTLVELVYDPHQKHTELAVGKGSEIHISHKYALASGTLLAPYSANNNLIKHEVILFAAHPEPFGSVVDLITKIEEYIHRYVDLGNGFRTLAAYYILLTWVYDAFNELPYLRFRGDYGSGKTRALLVVGSLCHKAFFASGASTISPIFHVLDTFRGTLIFDEADFRFSDEKAELVKIFNNGNVKGFPVLRSALTQKKEFEPRAFNVFGPKVVAMRRSFEDQALESRFFTEEMGRKSLRPDIPISLPDCQKDEALVLRNMLLGYRFAMLPSLAARERLVDPSLSPRLNQILIPLLSIVEDSGHFQVIREVVGGSEASLPSPSPPGLEKRLALVLAEILTPNVLFVSVGEITAKLLERGEEADRLITTRQVGYLLRTRLHIATTRRHGIYVVLGSERAKLAEMGQRFGIMDPTLTNPSEPEEDGREAASSPPAA